MSAVLMVVCNRINNFNFAIKDRCPPFQQDVPRAQPAGECGASTTRWGCSSSTQDVAGGQLWTGGGGDPPSAWCAIHCENSAFFIAAWRSVAHPSIDLILAPA